MKNFSIKDILKSTLVMFLVCLIVTGMLAGTDYLTKKQIADNNARQEEQTRYAVLKMAKTFKAGDIDNDGTTDYYAGYDGDRLVGYTVTATEKGYGGDVTVMTGILFDGKVNDVAILSHSETPGLGANAQNPDFTNAFKQTFNKEGFAVSKDIKEDKSKNGNSGKGINDKSEKPEEIAVPNKIDAITGATITSRAVTRAVNKAIDIYYKIIEQEENTNG